MKEHGDVAHATRMNMNYDLWYIITIHTFFRQRGWASGRQNSIFEVGGTGNKGV